MIFQKIMTYFDFIQKDENARYKSWEHCHLAFLSNRIYTNEEQVDYLALHLAFYLASWGMLRGQSFLLQKDYRIHLPIVMIIQDERYARLWDCPIESLTNDSIIDLILECSERIKSAYKEKTKVVNGNITDGVVASQTLITKILLGTFGCTPAYDRYFISGNDLLGMPNERFGRKSLQHLAKFYLNNPEFNRAMEEIHSKGIYYPPAKLIDMYFWQTGFDFNTTGVKPETEAPVFVMTVSKQSDPIQRRERGEIKTAVEHYLQSQLDEAVRNGDEFVEIISSDVAKALKIKNRFPSITHAMKKFMREGDVILDSTPSGASSTEKFKYFVKKR